MDLTSTHSNCALCRHRGPTRLKGPFEMTFPTENRFVRFPTSLMEKLLLLRLTGTQWRILCWVIRQTFGWNRNSTRFSWYRIARELKMDRSGVVRAGNQLLVGCVLFSSAGEIGITANFSQWILPRPTKRHREEKHVLDVGRHRRKRMPYSPIEDGLHPNRWLQASVRRRMKDRSKEKSNTRDRSRSPYGSAEMNDGNSRTPPHMAGAAKPIPGKYDRLSQN